MSVGLVVGGCIIAGLGDFSFDLKGSPPPPPGSFLLQILHLCSNDSNYGTDKGLWY